MNLTQAFTAGIAVGATGAFTVSVLAWQIPKAVRRFLDWRAEHWSDADEAEIRSFEQYVGGFNTDTAELKPVSSSPAPVEWVRPDQEEGTLIPRWRPKKPDAVESYTGPPITHLRDWISWNYGDLLSNWSINLHVNQQNGGRHRLVP